jgi:hypothetical protein
MIDNNQFSVVGVSRDRSGVLKIRMSGDLGWRLFNLAQAGHTDVVLVDLEQTMSKAQAVRVAMELPEFADNTEAVAVFRDYLVKQGWIAREAKRRGRPPKAQVAETDEPVTETAPSAELVAAVTLTLDDIPRRDARGRMLSRAAREAMLAERILEGA